MKKILFPKINKLLIVFCFLFSSYIYAQENITFNTQTEDEALFLRRIAEFWEDQEYALVKKEIFDYFEKYPEGSLNDSLYAILGNISLNESDYLNAVNHYDNIKADEFRDKICFNLLGCLYQLNWHERLITECDTYLEKTEGDLKDKIKHLQALAYYNESQKYKDDKEKQKEFLEKTISKFELLLETKYETQAREYLSQIHSDLQDFHAAVKYYFDLAEKNPIKQEDYLFQAALLQTHFDKEKALETFSHIFEMNQNKKNEASYNKVLLLYEMQKYEDLLNEKDQLLKSINNDKKPLAQFFIGRALFNNKNYKDASEYLQESLEMEDKTSLQMKISLVMLMQCSYQLNDYDLFNKTFEVFSYCFPNDDQMYEGIFAKALLNKKNNNYELAKADFEYMINNYSNVEEKELFLFEYAHLLYLINDTENSREKFKIFIEKNQNHDLIKTSLNHIVNCSIKDLHNSTEERLIEKRQQLIEDIKYAMDNKSLFSNKELSNFKFLLSQTYFDMHDYSTCLNELEDIIKNNSENSVISSENDYISINVLAQANLMMGYCHKYLYNNNKRFIDYGEKAIALNSDLKDKNIVYINLFNSYLSLAKENEAIDDTMLLKAADFLYDAFKIVDSNINQANLLWLADYYYGKVFHFLENNYKNILSENSNLNEMSKKALDLFEHIKSLSKKDDKNNFQKIEEYQIKLAKLNKIQKNYPLQISLLEEIVSQYRFSPEINWQFKEEAVYELAISYNNYDKSISLYDEFLQTFNKDSKYKQKALLHQIRLKLSTIEKENFNPNNPELEKIITQLKTLSVQKVFENEPVHLEAALDYVDTLCYMENDNAWEKRLFLLSRLINDFTTEDDIISQDYQIMRKVMQDKQPLYNSYMTVIIAEKKIVTGYVEKRVEPLLEAQELLIKLESDNMVSTKFLHNRIQNMLKLIEEFKN